MIKNHVNSYQGGSENFKGYIRLSSNENNYGPSSKVICHKNNSKYSNIYPELDGNSLKLQLAKTFKINSNQIILGAGSDEILQMAYAAFTKPVMKYCLQSMLSLCTLFMPKF